MVNNPSRAARRCGTYTFQTHIFTPYACHMCLEPFETSRALEGLPSCHLATNDFTVGQGQSFTHKVDLLLKSGGNFNVQQTVRLEMLGCLSEELPNQAKFHAGAI